MIERERLVTSLHEIIEIALESGENAIFRGEGGTYDLLLPSIGRLYIDHLSFQNIKHDDEYFEKWEFQLYDRFSKFSEPFLSFVPERDEVRAWLIGHHHGLPSRLLDWTENVLVATYFAVEKNDPPEVNTDRRVYVYVSEREEKEHTAVFSTENRLIRKYSPPFVHQRIINQASIFTIHPEPYIDMKKLLLTDKTYRKDALRILTIQSKYLPKIKNDLNTLGFNASTIWPDLTGVTSYVKWYCLTHYASGEV